MAKPKDCTVIYKEKSFGSSPGWTWRQNADYLTKHLGDVCGLPKEDLAQMVDMGFLEVIKEWKTSWWVRPTQKLQDWAYKNG